MLRLGGTYNLEQPELAAQIGERKAATSCTGAQAVVTGNIGCMTQIRTHLLLGNAVHWHTVELLAAAYQRLARRSARTMHVCTPQA